MAREKFDYSHGDTGTEPDSSLNFESGDKPNSEYFDWKWYNTIRKINQLWDEFDRIDDDDDGIVNEADYANDADSSTYKGNDIDSDEDGVVDEADVAQEAVSVEARTSDPSDPVDGQVWIRTDL